MIYVYSILRFFSIHEMALNFIVSQLIVEKFITVRSRNLEFGELSLYGFFGINVVYHFFFFSFFFCLVIFLVVDDKLQHLDFLFHSILIFKYFKFCFGKIRLIRIFLRCDVFFSVFCGYY